MEDLKVMRRQRSKQILFGKMRAQRLEFSMRTI